MKPKIFMLLIIACGSFLCAESESEELSFAENFVRPKGIWRPPWDPPSTKPEWVMPLETPFAYDTMARRTFLTYDEAKKASKDVKRDRFLGITKFRENEYRVNTLVHYDLSPIIPENKKEAWLDKVHQYALFKAFEWSKRGAISIKDGKFYREESITGTNGYSVSGENLEEVKKQVEKHEDAVIESYIDYGKIYYSASRPVQIDLLQAAQTWIDLVNFAYEWSAVDELDGLRLGTPKLDKNGVRLFHEFLSGWRGQVSYVQIGDINKRLVSGITINHVERPLDFINDVLTGWLLDRDKCEVEGT
ncbi:MAG: hypothetical protein PHY48_13345 [Candidatus Cloacimonetes bacterium]|nr:hypothetical protein [Candidatus Cloacimonadota bacterium]